MEPLTVTASTRPIAPRVILISAFAVALVAIAWAFFNPQAQFLVFGALACAIVTVPTLRPGFDLLSMWSLVAVTVYIGCGVRSFFVAFEIDGARTINDLFLLSHPPSFFFWPSVLYLCALSLMAAGYGHVRSQTARQPTTFGRYLLAYKFGPMLHLVVATCAIVGFATLLLYAQRTGGLSLSRISAKRTTITGIDLGEGYQAFGQLRALNELSSYAFWLLLADFAHRRVPHSIFTARGVLLLGLFLNAAALPIYASSRSSVVYLLIVGAAIEICLGRPRISRRLLVTTGFAAVTVLTSLTFLRVAAQPTDDAEPLSSHMVFYTIGDALVFNRNFSDIPTTAQIVRAIPRKLPYEYGQTLASWAAAPIPRSLWPEKPLISSGPVIGITVFGTSRTGVPPGFVAEMYWNFALPGVLLAGWLFGSLLRRVSARFSSGLRRSPATAFFYCVCLFPFGGNAMSGGLGYATFTAAVAGFIAIILLFFAGAKREEATSPPGETVLAGRTRLWAARS